MLYWSKDRFEIRLSRFHKLHCVNCCCKAHHIYNYVTLRIIGSCICFNIHIAKCFREKILIIRDLNFMSCIKVA